MESSKIIAKQQINNMVSEIRKHQPNHLVVQIIDCKGEDVKAQLLKDNPNRAEEIEGMFNDKQFIESLKVIKENL